MVGESVSLDSTAALRDAFTAKEHEDPWEKANDTSERVANLFAEFCAEYDANIMYSSDLSILEHAGTLASELLTIVSRHMLELR